VPKVIDVVAPAGVSQAAELDPTRGAVAIEGVPLG
jgi:glucoamylase